MSRKPKLNDNQKARVVELHDHQVQQKRIAEYFGVSTRTIYRVLEEAGRIVTHRNLTDRDKDTLALVRQAGIGVPELKERLTRPLLTPHTLIQAVASMTNEQLGGFLVNVTRYRVDREALERKAAADMHRARNGEMHQEKLDA